MQKIAGKDNELALLGMCGKGKKQRVEKQQSTQYILHLFPLGGGIA
jgi:hypothetical protein